MIAFAGLHPATVARYGGTPTDSRIAAYRTGGDVVTGAQEQSISGTLKSAAVGALLGPVGAIVGGLGKIILAAGMPNAVGLPLELPGHGRPLDRHGMDQVIDGIEAQKADDQAALATATGKTCG